MTNILRSETCACYRDADGLHPCEALKAGGSDYDALYHIQRAFNLFAAPESPKRAVKLENGSWEAPCGCRVGISLAGKEAILYRCPEVNIVNHMDHAAQAVAAVMREQQAPPMPTDEEIKTWFREWHNGLPRDAEGSVRWSEFQEVAAAVKWALERRPS